MLMINKMSFECLSQINWKKRLILIGKKIQITHIKHILNIDSTPFDLSVHII